MKKWLSSDARLSNARNTPNSLTLKLKSGSTEGTDLYTFNGSAAKTLDIKQGSNITLTAAAGSLTIAAKDTTYTFTNKAATLAWGSTSTIATVGDTDITVTMPANPNTNTDTLMTQSVSTGNATYPILLCPTANATANQGAKTGIFGSGVKVNPSTSEVTATKFLGALQADKGTGSYVNSIKLGAGLINGSHTQFGALWNAPVKEYRVACATYPTNDNKIYWYSITNTNVTNSTNTTNKIMTWDGGTGVLSATGFSGPLTGNVTGNCSGSSGSCTGNAATVTGTAGTSILAWNSEVTLYTVGGHAVKAKLPANPNSNWTTHLYAGASNGNANAATTNGNTYLIICDNSTARDRRLIKGTGATTVTSDADGVITINSTNSTYNASSWANMFGATVAASISSNACSLNIANGSVFTLTVNANVTFTFTGAASGRAATFSLILTNGGSKTVTWPSSVKWAGGSVPSLTASGIDVLTFITPNGGTNWYGVASAIGAA